MDNYTKMCKLLEPLQKDKYTEPSKYRYWLNENNFIFLPDSDWLMEKLKATDFDVGQLKYVWYGQIYNGIDIYGDQTISFSCQGATPQEALLKLVAFKLWGLEWKNERWV